MFFQVDWFRMISTLDLISIHRSMGALDRRDVGPYAPQWKVQISRDDRP